MSWTDLIWCLCLLCYAVVEWRLGHRQQGVGSIIELLTKLLTKKEPSMAIVQKPLEIAKETDDVMALFVDFIKKVKAKKPMSEIMVAEVPALITAIEGVEQVPEEAKNLPAMFRTVGGRTGEIVEALIAK